MLTASDGNLARNGVELGIDHQFWSDGASTQLRTGKVEVVPLFETMVGKLIPLSHPDAYGLPCGRNKIHACDLGFAGNNTFFQQIQSSLHIGRGLPQFVCDFGLILSSWACMQ